MRLGVLGSLRLAVSGREVSLRSALQRRLLAVLACHANTTVPRTRLVDALWEAPPESAADNLRQYVSQLRRQLGGSDRIVHERDGYRLVVQDSELDAARFEEAILAADHALSDGDDSRAEELLGEAVGLWRGNHAYVEVAEVPSVLPEVRRLAEARIRAIEQRCELRLRRGDHDRLVPDLAGLVSEHPLRERLRCQWALALYRAGRQDEALEACRDGHRVLVAELGIEPGRPLRDLEQAMLRQDPDLDPVDSEPARSPGDNAAVRPAELPADPSTFTGRTTETDRLCAMLSRSPERASMPVVVVAGVGGVGKSTLATRIAHRIVDDYPDGQLYVNLHGATPEVEPVAPIAALAGLLRSLGVSDSAIPSDVDEAAARFRSVTAGRRLLMLFDNALDAAQVRPLLPASTTCGVIVTSRRSLASLDGATIQPLGVLDDIGSAALLSNLIGKPRAAAEPEAVGDIVHACGRLPLALRIIGARLTAQPNAALRPLANRLADERGRLSQLEADELGIRASFWVSYRDLGETTARVFRRMSLLDCADLDAAAITALAGLTADETADALERLVDVQLVESQAPGRYRMHDLIRLFARERAKRCDTEKERADAVYRGISQYLATARAISRTIEPTSRWRLAYGPEVEAHDDAAASGTESANSWVDAEVGNLVRLVRQSTTCADGGPELAIALTAAILVPFVRRTRWHELVEIGGIAVTSAADVEPALRGLACDALAWGKVLLEDYRDVAAYASEGLAAFREAGEHQGETIQLIRLCRAHSMLENLDEALDHGQRALKVARRHGDRSSEGKALSHLGLVYMREGRIVDSTDTHVEALEAARVAGDSILEWTALANLAEAHRRAGRPDTALPYFERALERAHTTSGSGWSFEAVLWWNIGRAHRDRGDVDRAHEYWRASLDLLYGLGLVDDDELRTISQSDTPATPRVIARYD